MGRKLSMRRVCQRTGNLSVQKLARRLELRVPMGRRRLLEIQYSILMEWDSLFRSFGVIMYLILRGNFQRGMVFVLHANARNDMIRRLIERSQEMMDRSKK